MEWGWGEAHCRGDFGAKRFLLVCFLFFVVVVFVFFFVFFLFCFVFFWLTDRGDLRGEKQGVWCTGKVAWRPLGLGWREHSGEMGDEARRGQEDCW